MSYAPHQSRRRSSSRSDSGQSSRQSSRPQGKLSGLKLRLLIAAAIVLFSVVSYWAKGDRNRITGEIQRVDMTVKDEILLGLQGVGSMGTPSLNPVARRDVEQVGDQLVDVLRIKLGKEGIAIPYQFKFHLLADGQTVNAFALPGGQVFITEGLYRRLDSVGQLAGVLGHEIGHVLERHGAERMATGNLWNGIAGAAGVAGGDVNSTRAAAAVANLVTMKYGRDDEYEADSWGVELMVMAGYSPQHMVTLMDVLEDASGGGAPPEMLSTHPQPKNRREYINRIIAERYPEGIPGNLQ